MATRVAPRSHVGVCSMLGDQKPGEMIRDFNDITINVIDEWLVCLLHAWPQKLHVVQPGSLTGLT